jgi:predicted phosphoadenosine phosphosulfate sulfurtransferase
MEYPKLTSDNDKDLEVEFFHTDWEENYSKCEEMIDSVNKNNQITKENFIFVEKKLSQLN